MVIIHLMNHCRLCRLLITCVIVLACSGTAVAQEGSTVTEMPVVAETPEILKSGPGIPPADVTADVLRQILADEKYISGEYTKIPEESWLEKVFNRLRDLFRGIGIPINSDLSLLMAAALAILLIALIVRIVWDLFSRRSIAADTNDDSASEKELSPEGLRRAAAAAAAAGDLRKAIRLRFLAVLAEADVPLSAVMTNSQIRRLIRREHPGLSEQFGGLVLAFENAWYGGLQLSTGAYNEADEMARSLEQELGGSD